MIMGESSENHDNVRDPCHGVVLKFWQDWKKKIPSLSFNQFYAGKKIKDAVHSLW
jgi:hypothetical protein